MPTLSNPTLDIDILTGTTNYLVTAKVRVDFTSRELSRINPPSGEPGISVQLRSQLWGSDRGEPTLGDNDQLLTFPTRNITRSQTYIFSRVVSGTVLNEDIGRLPERDEIYNTFRLVSAAPELISNRLRNSPIIRGYYGPFE
jgi:hypothetical protein